MRWLAVTAVLALAGCSAAPTAPHDARPGNAPAAAPGLSQTSPDEILLAIIQGNPVCQDGCTVSIVGLDGRVRAAATFTKKNGIGLQCEGRLTAPSVQVAAGSVYYLENGAVHRLRPTGTNEIVWTLPMLTDQQVTWFAISPDGTKILASIFSIPPIVPSNTCPQHAAGDLQVQLLEGTLGGPLNTVRAERSPFGDMKYPVRNVLSIVGWDAVGPIGVADTRSGGMGSIDGTVWWGAAAHLDSRGKPGDAIGGQGCNPLFGEVPNGRLICYDVKRPTVRDGAGSIEWTLQPLDANDDSSYGSIALSPDSSRAAFVINKSSLFDSSVIRGRDGVRIGLGNTFQPQGWLDSETVIGQSGAVVHEPATSTCPSCSAFKSDGLALLRLATPTRIDSLHLKGGFLGLIATS